MNKVICGDCLDVVPTLPEKSIDLIIADPPYNIGIDKWDRIKNYYDWLLERFTEFERVLKDNGTLWLFHISFPMLSTIHQRLEKETNFRFKQFITINKGIQSIAGRSSENLRSYPRATEYLAFYTFEDEAKASSPEVAIRNYLRSELRKFGIANDVNRLFWENNWCSKNSNIASHFFGLNTQTSLPTKENYERLQTTGFFKKPYEKLKMEYEKLRYVFHLELGVTDVWGVDFYKDRVPWHPTSKPLKLIERIIKTSTNEGDVVLDPFLGSGTTALACKQLNRKCLGIEINPKYVAMAKTRKVQSLHRKVRK